MDMKSPSSWLHKIVGSSLILLTLAVLGVVGVAGWLLHRYDQKETKRDQLMEMVVSNLRVVNEQTAIREIIEDKFGDKLSSEQKARMTFEINDGCRRTGVPIPLLFGLMEQESGFDPKAVSPKGAVGVMQCMPDTAVRYFKQRGLTFSIESLYDPVLNVSLGIDILADKQEAAIAQGKATKEDWIFALYYYCGKGDSYARGVLALSVHYKRLLDSPLQSVLRKALQESEAKDLPGDKKPKKAIP